MLCFTGLRGGMCEVGQVYGGANQGKSTQEYNNGLGISTTVDLTAASAVKPNINGNRGEQSSPSENV